MRFFAILATIYAATLGTTSALVDEPPYINWVQVDATGYDDRLAADGGCYPSGCKPENTLDDSTDANSRWSCQGDILDDDIERCCITYTFEEPQDIVKMSIAFHPGDERTRTLDVFINGDYHSTITSSGLTPGYERFYLITKDTEDIKLCLDGDDDEWLSITEVKFALY